MALYVYGIMRAGDAARAAAEAGPDVPVRLEAVEHQGIAALASPAPGEELRLRRDNIVAHADVLQSAFTHGPVMPFRFGTLVADAETLARELLMPDAERLASRLEALDGKAELQVKAIYAEEPLLRAILRDDPALARTVKRTQGLPLEATHFERIRIGEAIAAAVQSRSAADGQALMDVLAPLALVNVVSPPHHERAVMNAAFLVNLDELARFDQQVEALSEQWAPEMEFKLIGPLPPYSFADREVERGVASEARAGWV